MTKPSEMRLRLELLLFRSGSNRSRLCAELKLPEAVLSKICRGLLTPSRSVKKALETHFGLPIERLLEPVAFDQFANEVVAHV